MTRKNFHEYIETIYISNQITRNYWQCHKEMAVHFLNEAQVQAFLDYTAAAITDKIIKQLE